MKQITDDDLLKVAEYQNLVLDYYKVSLPKENLEKVLNKAREIKEQRANEAQANAIKKAKEERLAGIAKNTQSLKEFPEAKQKELISKLLEFQSQKGTLKNTTRGSLEISEDEIQWRYNNGWQEFKVLVYFEDLADISTYKLVDYYYWYDYASDPPFIAKPPVTESTLGHALNHMHGYLPV